MEKRFQVTGSPGLSKMISKPQARLACPFPMQSLTVQTRIPGSDRVGDRPWPPETWPRSGTSPLRVFRLSFPAMCWRQPLSRFGSQACLLSGGLASLKSSVPRGWQQWRRGNCSRDNVSGKAAPTPLCLCDGEWRSLKRMKAELLPSRNHRLLHFAEAREAPSDSQTSGASEPPLPAAGVRAARGDGAAGERGTRVGTSPGEGAGRWDLFASWVSGF